MKIGIFGDQRFLFDNSGRYYTRGNLRGVLLDEYARQFETVYLFYRTKASDLSWAPEKDLIQNERVVFVNLPTFEGPFGHYRHAANIRRCIQDRIDECDVCILRFCYQISCIATSITRERKIPTIAHLMGDAGASLANDERIPTRPLRRLVGRAVRRKYRKFVNRCDMVCGASKAVADLYAHPGRKTMGIADSCLTERFFLPPRPRMEGTPANILIVARINFAKNIEQVIRAVHELRRRNVDCVITIVGDGPDLDRLRRLTRDLGIEAAARFMGRVDARDDLIELYRDAHIAALTSLTEGLPSSVLESLAASLPVVGSDIPCMHELIEEGVNGYIVKIGDVGACADRLGRLIGNETLRGQMARAAGERGQEFRIDRPVAKLRTLCDDLIANPGRR